MLTVLGVTLGPVMNYCSLHRHDCWEVILNLSGSGEERLGDGRYSFFPGSVTVCPPGTPHMKDCPSGQMWQDLSLRFSDKGFSLNHLRFSDDFEQSLSKILHLMQTASARRESDGYCRALGEAVCALLREWDRRAPENALVERIQVELSRHFSDPEFSAGRALEKMDYCPDYLRRLFRQSTGETPTEALTRLRLTHACTLLSRKGSAMPVREIALLSGFYDADYFSRLFRRAMGCSPRAYRTEH